MKIISIWQPFASLAAKGFKTIETRGWPAPPSVVGQTIGIASTKSIKPEQRAHFEDEEFQAHYRRLGMPGLEELPLGFLLGTVTLDSVELITEEWLEEVSAEEQAYGWWDIGNYGWRLTNARELLQPIAIRGKQGIYDWHGVLPSAEEEREAARAPRPADLRGDLRIV